MEDLALIAALRSAVELAPDPLRHLDADDARDLVRESGLAQHVIAAALGVSPASVGNWLSPTAPRRPSGQYEDAWQRFLSLLARRTQRMVAV